MFKNDYQGGPFFEVFTPQGKDPTAHWKTSGGIKKVYDKEVKSYVYNLEGSPATTKMQLPKDAKQSLTLVQRYLIFQIFVPRGQEFSIELGVTDLGMVKRRLFLSTSQKETQVSLHARIPLTIMRRHVWLNLCVDMVSLVGDTWRGQTYKSIESICVAANCKLRRIFTMKSQPPDTAGDEEMYGCPDSNTGELDHIPKQCQFASDVLFITQLLTLRKIKHAERLKGGGDTHRPATNLEIDLNASGRRTSLNSSDSAYHIAFGTKVPGAPTQSKNKSHRWKFSSGVPSSLESSFWGGNLTNRSARSTMSRADDCESTYRDLSASISSKDGFTCEPGGSGESRLNDSSISSKSVLHRRQFSDPASKEDLEMYSRIEYEKQDIPISIVQPHPPREPSSDRLRRRIRVKNGGNSTNKERVSSAGSLNDETPGSVSQSNSASSTSKRNSHHTGHTASTTERGMRRKRLTSDGEVVALNADSGGSDTFRNKSAEHPRKHTEKGHDRSFSESGVGSTVSDSQSYKKEYNQNNYQDGPLLDDSMMDVIDMLNHGLELADGKDSSDDEREEVKGEYEESDEDDVSDEGMYLFVSKPKSAPRRHVSPSQFENGELELPQLRSPNFSRGAKPHRGPNLANDFVHSSDSSVDEEEDVLRRKKLPGSRPTSGTSSRPHSGSTVSSRPQSGSTSRPHSGTTVKPQSATSSVTSSPMTNKNSCHTRPQRKDKIETDVNIVPKVANESPELRISTQLPTDRSDLSVNGGLSNRSVSRMNRKSLREIPQDDVRLSVIKSSEKPYDFTKYSALHYDMADITESFEARMLSSMKRQANADLEDVESPRKISQSAVTTTKSPRNPNQADGPSNHRHLYDFSPTLTSDDDTSLSTWQAPPLQPHNYHEEMKTRVSSDTLTSSNPRDWSGAFSPPIVFPSEQSGSTEDLSMASTSVSPRKNNSSAGSGPVSPRKLYAPSSNYLISQDPGTDEDELDLLYDSCLNCYYDPKTCKYYELRP